VSASSSSIPAGSSRSRRLRWLLWTLVALAGIVVGSLVAILSVSRGSGVVASGVVAAGPTAPPVSWPAGKRRAPAIELVDQRGRRVSLAAYRGRPVIVTFMDPLCRDFCPLEAAQLNELERGLPPRARPAVLSVSVNVYGNTGVDLLRAAAKWRFRPEWRWAIGSPRELANVWRRYQIGVLVTTKKRAGVTTHDVSHTEAAYVIDRNGFERDLFLWPFRAEDVSAVLRRLASAES
jgi:protein SCO1